MKAWIKGTLWIAAAAGLVLLVVRAFRPTPVLVDDAPVARGALAVSVDEDGRTRVRERYTLSAPLHARLLRTPVRPGDALRAGETLVAELVALAPSLLDPRSRAEAEARLQAAEAAALAAAARREQAESDARFAASELERVRKLHASGFQPREALERAERDERTSAAAQRAARFGEDVARFELELARASLHEADARDVGAGADVPPLGPEVGDDVRGPEPGRRLALRSPVDGRVLRVFEESARALAAGTPIVEVGDTAALELVADFLTQDAVLIRPGMDVRVHGFGDAELVLRGQVRLVEPSGFTKVSALGVEEQRVLVIVDPLGAPANWARLGDGYRVELSVLLFEADDVLVVPAGALFRTGSEWTAFVVADDRARLRTLRLGRSNGLEAEVLEGLVEGERVVLYPSDLVTDGALVEARAAPSSR